MAQRNPNATITALDIDEDAVALASVNFRNSPFSSRLNAVLQDFKKHETHEKFDLIVSNPPYFEENPSEKDVLARQQTELSFGDLIQNASKILSDKGILSVIIPFTSGMDFEQICRENNLFPTKKITIFGIKTATPKRLILEFGLNAGKVIETEFVIEKSPRKYSENYLELTKDFHLFQK